MNVSTSYLSSSGIVVFESECSRITRSLRTSMHVDRADNDAIVRIVQFSSQDFGITANQCYGHRYLVLNSPIHNLMTLPLINQTNSHVVHIHLQDYASFHKLERIFTLSFKEVSAANRFIRKVNDIIQPIVKEIACGEEFYPREDEHDQATEDEEDEEVGVCNKCGYFGIVGTRCGCMKNEVNRFGKIKVTDIVAAYDVS